MPRVSNIENIGDVFAAMEDGRPAPDHDELHARVAKLLNGKFKVHA